LKKYSSKENKEFVSNPLFDEKIILNKDTNYPKISIVTPSYNQAEFLDRTILSVLNQNFPNLEYIIIDGGSTDGSVEIIKKYEKYLAYWISEKDEGQSDAINKGFKESTGDILAWLNSDDTYTANTLLKVGRFFANNSRVDIIYGDAYIIDRDDKIMRELKDVSFNKRALIYGGINIHQASTFWRRKLFLEVNMLNTDLHYSMDYDLWLRFIKRGAKFILIPQAFANFRFHKLSKTVCKSQQAIQESIDAKAKIFQVKKPDLLYSFWHFIYRLRRLFLFILQKDFNYMFFRGNYKK